MFAKQWRRKLGERSRWFGRGVPVLAGQRLRYRLNMETLEERNLLSFFPPVDYPAGGISEFAFVADFNGDGIPDLLTVNQVNNSLSVLLGTGNGTFGPPNVLHLNTYPNAVALGHFHGDGIFDIVVAGVTTVSVLDGVGDGTFRAERVVASGMNQDSVAVGDFTGDGFDDIVTSSIDSEGRVRVFINRGDGTFQNPVLYQAGNILYGVAVADFRGNGILDLAVNSHVAGGNDSVNILLGNGDGTFQDPLNYTVDANSYFAAVADFRGNGILDLVITNNGNDSVSVLLGNGDGTFQDPVNISTSPHPFRVSVGDFNGDGVPDLAIWSGVRMDETSKLGIYLGAGDGTFQLEEERTLSGTEAYKPRGASADLNGDGFDDLVYPSGSSQTVTVLLNDGNWTAPHGGSAPGRSTSHDPTLSQVHAAALDSETAPIAPVATFSPLSRASLPDLDAVDEAFRLSPDSMMPTDIRWHHRDPGDLNASANPLDPLGVTVLTY